MQRGVFNLVQQSVQTFTGEGDILFKIILRFIFQQPVAYRTNTQSDPCNGEKVEECIYNIDPHTEGSTT